MQTKRVEETQADYTQRSGAIALTSIQQRSLVYFAHNCMQKYASPQTLQSPFENPAMRHPQDGHTHLVDDILHKGSNKGVSMQAKLEHSRCQPTTREAWKRISKGSREGPQPKGIQTAISPTLNTQHCNPPRQASTKIPRSFSFLKGSSIQTRSLRSEKRGIVCSPDCSREAAHMQPMVIRRVTHASSMKCKLHL